MPCSPFPTSGDWCRYTGPLTEREDVCQVRQRHPQSPYEVLVSWPNGRGETVPRWFLCPLMQEEA